MGVLMRIPPPLLFVVAFFAGIGIQRVAPLPMFAPAVRAIGRSAGLGLATVGLLIILSSVIIFMVTRTTIIPFGTAKHMVVRGPFRFTRNPMYLGLVLIYFGVALVLHELWTLAILPLPLIVMQRVVIPFEEARMREAFGAEYAQYCARVRRWI